MPNSSKPSKRAAVVVMPNRDTWEVHYKGRMYGPYPNQKDAIQRGKKVATTQGCELRVYRSDKSLQSIDNFFSDPFPPRSN